MKTNRWMDCAHSKWTVKTVNDLGSLTLNCFGVHDASRLRRTERDRTNKRDTGNIGNLIDGCIYGWPLIFMSFRFISFYSIVSFRKTANNQQWHWQDFHCLNRLMSSIHQHYVTLQSLPLFNSHRNSIAVLHVILIVDTVCLPETFNYFHYGNFQAQ